MWRVRVFFRIAVGMVHTVQYSIRSWVQEGRTLRQKSHKVEKSFPALAHGKHLVRCVPVLKKGLTEERKKPMRKKKNKDNHRYLNLINNTLLKHKPPRR